MYLSLRDPSLFFTRPRPPRPVGGHGHGSPAGRRLHLDAHARRGRPGPASVAVSASPAPAAACLSLVSQKQEPTPQPPNRPFESRTWRALRNREKALALPCSSRPPRPCLCGRIRLPGPCGGLCLPRDRRQEARPPPRRPRRPPSRGHPHRLRSFGSTGPSSPRIRSPLSPSMMARRRRRTFFPEGTR